MFEESKEEEQIGYMKETEKGRLRKK